MVSHWQIVVRFLLRFNSESSLGRSSFSDTLAFADMMIRYTKTATCSALPARVHLLVYRSTRREGPAFVPPGPFPEVPSHGGICL
jgi:hypothetical protein